MTTVKQLIVLENLHLFIISMMEEAAHLLVAVEGAVVETFEVVDKVVHKTHHENINQNSRTHVMLVVWRTIMPTLIIFS